MTTVLYNDYKLNYNEYMKTVLYTEKILYDNNSDQNKLIKIYEKAIKSAENMFKRMQLEVETNPMLRNKYEEFTEMQNEIAECKKKLRTLKEELMKKEHRNVECNSYDDRMYLLNDVDLLEKGDVYINQSKILMDNANYIGDDVMRNLNTQKENIKKNITNISFVSENLNNAKKIMKNLKYKEIVNKYRLYIIYIFIVLTFILIVTVKYNRHIKQFDVQGLKTSNGEPSMTDFTNTLETNNKLDSNGNNLASSSEPSSREQPSSVFYDFLDYKDINEKSENVIKESEIQNEESSKEKIKEANTKYVASHLNKKETKQPNANEQGKNDETMIISLKHVENSKSNAKVE